MYLRKGKDEQNRIHATVDLVFDPGRLHTIACYRNELSVPTYGWAASKWSCSNEPK